MLRANDITFSLIVAESKNDSFATKFALKALIYVLYAKESIKTEISTRNLRVQANQLFTCASRVSEMKTKR